MQKLIVAVLVVVALAVPAHAAFTYPQLPQRGTALSDWVPEGWKVLAEAKGDLNKDNLEDIAAVIERGQDIEHVPGCDKWRDQSSRAPRTLIILLAQASGGFRMAAENHHIVLRADEGGIFGDPFESLAVDRGSVVLRHYGGSAWRWAITYRFRLQDGAWALIGYTDESYHNISQYARQYDYNLLTGKVKITTTGENGGLGCYSCFKGDACPPSPKCEKNETLARTPEVWKTLPGRPPITLDNAACVEILPFVPYE